ncbi:MAG: lysophospholipase L1-like esterase [Halieaceae bacterium]|jgi:lysophospholipase L1-like esterase
MYEWRTLRSLAMLLLCLPLLHLAFIISTDLNNYLDPSPEVWAKHMAALVQADMRIELPERPILVVGGQRVGLWQDLPAMLLPRKTLLRSLGDATIEDLSYYFDRLVGHYRPDIIVLFPGYADLHLRDDKTAADFAVALEEFLAHDAVYKATSWRYVLTPLAMPLHPDDDVRIVAMANSARELAARVGKVTVIDANPALAGLNGRPNPAYFRSDGVNLNAAGYTRVSLLLQAKLREDGAL